MGKAEFSVEVGEGRLLIGVNEDEVGTPTLRIDVIDAAGRTVTVTTDDVDELVYLVRVLRKALKFLGEMT